MEHVHPAIVLGVPHQFVVVPQLLNPHVGRHDLVPQVLQNVQILDSVKQFRARDVELSMRQCINPDRRDIGFKNPTIVQNDFTP